MSAPSRAGSKVRSIARNPRARHEYHILETWEAGLVLTGTEVKALRMGRASIAQAYAHPRAGELWIEGMHIPPYEAGTIHNHDPRRPRKLLLNRSELRELVAAFEQKGLALVPLELYFSGPHAKLRLALGRGKKLHDRREDLKRRAAEREMARSLRPRR